MKGTGVNPILKVVGIPLLIELANAVIYTFYVHKPWPQALSYWGALSFFITLILLFYVGWRTAIFYKDKVLIRAVTNGFLLWLIPTAVVACIPDRLGQEGTTSFLEGAIGALVAFGLFSPFLVGIPLLAVWVKSKVESGN
jgi:hypothetical protein